jgi:hypothetical protein
MYNAQFFIRKYSGKHILDSAICHAIAQVVIYWLLTTEVWVQSWVNM